MDKKSLENLKKYIPILDWLPNYRMSYLKGDISAGLTVGIMLIPQGMAYAMLAGLEPIHGLYAATVPLMLYAVFGSSRHLAVGPDALVSLLTAAGVAALVSSGPEEYLLYALTLTLMVGLIRLVIGLLGFGFIANFLSNPVINGFTSAAAIIIGLSQLRHLLRIQLPNSQHVQEIMAAFVQNFGDTHWITFGIGMLGIAIIKFAKKIGSSFAGALAAIVVGILLVWALRLDDHGVQIVGDVPGGLPPLSLPSFEPSLWGRLFPVAMTIALIGFAQSFAIAKTLQAKHKDYTLRADQELIALGISNLGAAFFSGYPVSGGFSRSAVNDNSGANTGVSSIISAALVTFTLLFLTGLFYFLPYAVLAAVVLAAVSGLVDLRYPAQLWKRDRGDFWMLAATFFTTLIFGIEAGILSGMLLSLLMVIYRASRPHMAQLGRVPGTGIFRNIKRFDHLEVWEELLMVRIDGPIYFANVEYIREKLNNWIREREGKARMIILDMESVTSLDSTGVRALSDWIRDWRLQQMDICLTGTKGPVRDILKRWDLIEVIGKDHVYMDIPTAIAFYNQKLDDENINRHAAYSTQSNIKK